MIMLLLTHTSQLLNFVDDGRPYIQEGGSSRKGSASVSGGNPPSNKVNRVWYDDAKWKPHLAVSDPLISSKRSAEFVSKLVKGEGRKLEVNSCPIGLDELGKLALSPLTVAVVVPCYNCARYLGEALKSIREQDYTSVVVYFLDDASTDGTWEAFLDGTKGWPEGSSVGVKETVRNGPSYGKWRLFKEAEKRLNKQDIIMVLDGGEWSRMPLPNF
jgi:hypothetical protein